MTYFEVWGYDTFAREDYLCGRFTSYAAAKKELRKLGAEVKNLQDVGLQDTFCITIVTDKDIRLREEREKKIRNARNKEQSFNEEHLAECVHNLLVKFREALRDVTAEEIKRLRKNDECLTQDVWWDSEEDCFTQILFETLFRTKNALDVNMGISVKGGRYSQGGKTTICAAIVGTYSELIKWSQTQEAVQECVEKFKKLIEKIYSE